MNRLRQQIHSPWFGVAALCALVLLAYYNVLNGDFLFDDEFLIQRNRFLRSWSSVGEIFLSSSTGGAGHVDSFYRPIQGLLYLFVNKLVGPTPLGFHALNVTIHTLNAVMILLLGRRLGWSHLGVWLAAAIWAVHPVHTEAVSYVSATADSLYTLACLLGVFVLLPDFSQARVLAATAILLLGLFSKESGIVLAALAPVVFFYSHKQRLQWRAYLRFWPLWVTALLYLIARKTVLDFNNSFDFYKTTNVYTESILVRLYTFFATLPSYISLLLWPAELHMDRSFPIFTDFWLMPVIVGAGIFAMALALLIYSRGQRALAASFAILWFFAAHAPHTGVLLPVNSLFLEHWLYLPSIGFFLVVLNGLVTLKKSQAWAVGVTAVSLAVVGLEVYATQTQNLVWRDPIGFYRNILRYEKVGSARVHNNLAMAVSSEHPEEAIEHYQKAIAIEDRYPQTHHNLALLLLMNGQVESGIKELKRALEINPRFFYSYQVLSEVYGRLGDKAQSEYYAQQFELMRNKFGQ